MTHAIALIVAAGRGHRAGGPLPKQYRILRGEPVLGRSVRAFATHPRIDGVRVVIHPDDAPLYDEAVAGLDPSAAARLLPPTPGGATRQESVYRGLASLTESAPEIVLIHDGARPFVSDEIITGTLDALAHHDGAIAALPVHDTLKRAANGDAAPAIVGTVDRTQLWRAQTPQTFRYSAILAAHEQARNATHTDDAAVAEAAGLSVALVAGHEDNLKITQEADFARAERILATQPGHDTMHDHATEVWESRVGHGFDVHRFGPGDHVMLCGINVPHAQGVVSHSDGDVGLHALVDALLGAIGAGDIGDHFPPSDPAWRDADSALFVEHALKLIEDRDGTPVHVDVTLICQAPRIGPHRVKMIERIAGLLGMAHDRVSVKATTTERLGFTGRGEGIAAHAVATVRVPA